MIAKFSVSLQDSALHYMHHYISFTIRSQSCRSIGFWFAHVQTKLSYRNMSYNAETRQGQLTFRSNATPTFRHHLHSPSRSYLVKRSCNHLSREYSFVDTRHHGAMRDTSLYFSSEPLVSRTRRNSIPAIRV